MLISQRSTGFQFDNQAILHDKIGEVVAQHGSICIGDLKRLLLFDLQSRLAEPVCKPVLIDLFQVAVAQVDMQAKRSLPDPIA